MASAAQLLMRFGAKMETAGMPEVKAYLQGIDEQTKKLKGSTDSQKNAVDTLSKAYQFLATSAVVLFLKKCIEETAAAQEKTFLLKQRVEGLGVSWKDAKGPLDAYFATLSATTRFGRGESSEALSLMIDKTRDLGAAQYYLVDAMGLSVARGMSLAESSDMIAGASVGQARVVQQLARVLGMTGDEAKRSDLVLAELHKRFGDLAQGEDTAAASFAKFRNAMGDAREELGARYLPAVTKVIGVLPGFIRLVEALGNSIYALNSSVYTYIVHLAEAQTAVMTGHFKRAGQIMTAAGKEFKKEWEQLGKDWKAAIDMAAGNVEKKLEISAGDSGKKIRQMSEDTFKRVVDTAASIANTVGIATASGLQGNTKAWKEASVQIIDTLIKQAQAAVMANAIWGASQEVKTKGVIGIATAAPMIAWGAAQVAALAAIGQGLKGAIGDGGSSAAGAAGAGGGMASPTVSPASAPAAVSSGPVINVTVSGGVIDNRQTQADLAAALSDIVENGGARLIASGGL